MTLEPAKKAAPTLEFLPMAPPEAMGEQGEIPVTLPGRNQPFVTGAVDTLVGQVPCVSSTLEWADHWGALKVRLDVGRMNYRVDPGLYALGRPDAKSPVFVTANYKLSFDLLRRALTGRDGWVLVLDTKGINVWCAAGKGTFGTAELVNRVRGSGLERVVEARRLIVPQLGAPGVSAHRVRQLTGFQVIYGPIRAEDLPLFLDAGYKATPEMRRKSFTLGERAILIPIELVHALKKVAILLPIFALLGGLSGSGAFWSNAGDQALAAAVALLTSVGMGTILMPLLFPYLPGRAFGFKGLILSAAGALIFLAVTSGREGLPGNLDKLAFVLMIFAFTSYLAMDFTGASTCTSFSGVKKEMRFALPLETGAGAAGVILWLAVRFWGG